MDNSIKNMALGCLFAILLFLGAYLLVSVKAAIYEGQCETTAVTTVTTAETKRLYPVTGGTNGKFPLVVIDPSEIEPETDEEANREPVTSETVTDVEIPIEPETPVVRYFNVPLSDDIQDHIFDLCEQYELDPAIVIAMIGRESGYQIRIMGDGGNSYGLMQIQPRWHQDRMNSLGCTNLLDPYQNISVGLHLLNELNGYGKGLEWALMAYNGGPSYANRLRADGEVSKYVVDILETSKRLELERNDTEPLLGPQNEN